MLEFVILAAFISQPNDFDQEDILRKRTHLEVRDNISLSEEPELKRLLEEGRIKIRKLPQPQPYFDDRNVRLDIAYEGEGAFDTARDVDGLDRLKELRAADDCISWLISDLETRLRHGVIRAWVNMLEEEWHDRSYIKFNHLAFFLELREGQSDEAKACGLAAADLSVSIRMTWRSPRALNKGKEWVSLGESQLSIPDTLVTDPPLTWRALHEMMKDAYDNQAKKRIIEVRYGKPLFDRRSREKP